MLTMYLIFQRPVAPVESGSNLICQIIKWSIVKEMNIIPAVGFVPQVMAGQACDFLRTL